MTLSTYLIINDKSMLGVRYFGDKNFDSAKNRVKRGTFRKEVQKRENGK